MIERYSREEMSNIWTDQNRYEAWLEVEILACEAWSELGYIPKEDVKSVLQNVHRTLEERGYNAVNQIVGYLLSGDPAYIPRQNEARNQIRHIDRDVIMEELVSNYLKESKN